MPTTKVDRRKPPDPGGCPHILIPGSVCDGCWATIPLPPRKERRARRT